MNKSRVTTETTGPFHFVLGKFDEVATAILHHIHHNQGGVILPTSLNDIASASQNKNIATAYSLVDICVTDGMPLVWWFSWRLKRTLSRVYGPDLMRYVLTHSQPHLRHLFFGAQQSTLERLAAIVRQTTQVKQIAVVEPPMASADRLVQDDIFKQVVAHSPDVVWVGLSSPKQILVATAWKEKLPNTTFMCVGAAFDFITNQKKSAPRVMQLVGLEWLFRLLSEPRRLAARYLVIIPRFLLTAGFSKFWSWSAQLISKSKSSTPQR